MTLQPEMQVVSQKNATIFLRDVTLGLILQKLHEQVTLPELNALALRAAT
jgi:hypothetical protein